MMNQTPKYEKTSDPIKEEDVRINILTDILTWSENQPKFNASFVLKMEDLVIKNGFIDPNEYNALVNIYEKWNVQEYMARLERLCDVGAY